MSDNESKSSDKPLTVEIPIHRKHPFSDDDDDEFYTEQAPTFRQSEKKANEKETSAIHSDTNAAASLPNDKKKEPNGIAAPPSSKTAKGHAVRTTKRKKSKAGTTAAPMKFPKPRGREKQGCEWDGEHGVWVPVNDAPKRTNTTTIPATITTTTTTTNAAVSEAKENGKLVPRPRGRSKEGHDWDGVNGIWVPLEGAAKASGTSKPPAKRKVASTGTKRTTTSAKSLHHTPQPAASKRAKSSSNSSNEAYNLSYRPTRNNRTSNSPSISARAKDMRDQIVQFARKDLWSDKEEVIRNALEKMVDFCDDSADGERCREYIFGTGAHTLIVKLLERHRTSAALQSKGLELLFNLTISPDPADGEALISLGAVEVAYTAMLAYPTNASIQMFACILLGNLTMTVENWDTIQKATIVVQQQQQQLAMSSQEKTDNARKRKSTDNADNPIGTQEPNEDDNESNDNNDDDGSEPDKDDEPNKMDAEFEDARETQSTAAEPSVPPPTTCQLFVAVQAAQEYHADNEQLQEAVAFMLDRIQSIVGPPLTDLLVETAPTCMNGLLIAKKKYAAHNPNIRSRVKDFFKSVAAYC